MKKIIFAFLVTFVFMLSSEEIILDGIKFTDDGYGSLRAHNIANVSDVKMFINEKENNEFAIEAPPTKSLFFVIIDNSGSIILDDFLEIRNRVGFLIKNVGEQDLLKVYKVSDSFSTIYEMDHANPELVKNIARLQREGKKSRIFDSVKEIVAEADKISHDPKFSDYYPMVLLFSDADDIGSISQLSVDESKIPFFYFSYFSKADSYKKELLVNLAGRSKGKTLFKPTEKEIMDLFFNREKRFDISVKFKVNVSEIKKSKSYFLDIKENDRAVRIDLKKYFEIKAEKNDDKALIKDEKVYDEVVKREKVEHYKAINEAENNPVLQDELNSKDDVAASVVTSDTKEASLLNDGVSDVADQSKDTTVSKNGKKYFAFKLPPEINLNFIKLGKNGIPDIGDVKTLIFIVVCGILLLCTLFLLLFFILRRKKGDGASGSGGGFKSSGSSGGYTGGATTSVSTATSGSSSHLKSASSASSKSKGAEVLQKPIVEKKTSEIEVHNIPDKAADKKIESVVKEDKAADAVVHKVVVYESKDTVEEAKTIGNNNKTETLQDDDVVAVDEKHQVGTKGKFRLKKDVLDREKISKFQLIYNKHASFIDEEDHSGEQVVIESKLNVTKVNSDSLIAVGDISLLLDECIDMKKIPFMVNRMDFDNKCYTYHLVPVRFDGDLNTKFSISDAVYGEKKMDIFGKTSAIIEKIIDNNKISEKTNISYWTPCLLDNMDSIEKSFTTKIPITIDTIIELESDSMTGEYYIYKIEYNTGEYRIFVRPHLS